MKNILKGIGVMAAAAIFLAGCASLTSRLGISAPPASGSVLFQDNFSDANSGWSVLSEPDKVITYDEGVFRFVIGASGYASWSTPHLVFDDASIEVEATRGPGPEDDNYGIICRYQDENNFYSLLISSDGYFGIAKMKDGTSTILGADVLEYSPAILTGEQANYLRAECSGTRLALWVNGQKLVDVTDPEFPSGEVGLIASTYNHPGLDVRFDNFIVKQP